MQWVAVMFVGFLVLGLRRSTTRLNTTVGVMVVVAGAVAVWYAQLSAK